MSMAIVRSPAPSFFKSRHTRRRFKSTLVSWLNTLRDGDQLRFVHDFKARYFRNSYPYFMAAVRALAKASYDTFSGIIPAPAFHAALSSVTESYADRFGFYVYDSDHAELLPMDAWLRTADLSIPYYMGSVIDYHSWMSLNYNSVMNRSCRESSVS